MFRREDGAVSTVVIEAGTTQTLKVRNPWPGKKVNVVSNKGGRKVIIGVTGEIVEFAGESGVRYLMENEDEPVAMKKFVPVTGTRASSAKRLGPVQIGLFAARD